MLQDWREAVLHLWDQGLRDFMGQRPLLLKINDEIIQSLYEICWFLHFY